MPVAGRPLDVAAVLEAMRTSPRPDGVPDQLETPEIARAVADSIWTFDGQPWTAMVASGSCGSATCLLEIAGSRAGAAGEDLWVFAVDPATSRVDVSTAEVNAIPTRAYDRLDAAARAVAPAGLLEGLTLANVAWTPPPAPNRYRLSYRSGGEEGSCAIEVVIDGQSGRLVEHTATDC